MTLILWLLACTAAVLLVVQGYLISAFSTRIRRSVMHRRGTPSSSDEGELAQSPASIVLCVRGADPSLPDCVRAIADQDHSNFELIVVADHEADPAILTIRNAIPSEFEPQVSWLILNEDQRLSTCSLKCSAILAACGQLSDDCQHVAFVDADTRPPRDWLRRLTQPLNDSGIGATTALRWYSPVDSLWGTHVRYVWNAAAIVQMWWYRIPWGGSLAIRRDVIRDSQLTDRWKTTLCEDTPLTGALASEQLRLTYVTDLVLDNHESCSLASLRPWIRRQLLTVRMHHPAWPVVFGHALTTTLLLIGLLVTMALAAVNQRWSDVLAALAILLVYQTGMVAYVAWIHAAIRRTESPGPTTTPGLTTQPGLPRLLIDISCSQVVYPVAALGALLARNLTWRKVSYRLGPGSRIERIEYVPYSNVPYSNESDRSTGHSID